MSVYFYRFSAVVMETCTHLLRRHWHYHKHSGGPSELVSPLALFGHTHNLHPTHFCEDPAVINAKLSLLITRVTASYLQPIWGLSTQSVMTACYETP